ncbi:MAG: prepilin-type N-terminal cleavage/methylation domain-containing protein [Nitrospirota bacterium]|jgi:prepilin-type N-terminal cleavage/methylation domain-containing protein
MRRTDRPEGFTLLEMLLALAIASAMLAVLYSTFFVSNKAVRGNEETLLRLHEVRAFMDVLKRELEAALPPEGQSHAFIIRDRDMYGAPASELSFTSHLSPLSGPARLGYRVEEKEDRLVLMKTLVPASQPSSPGGGGVSEPMEAEALEQVVSFAVEVKSRGSWITTWENQGLPEELRVTVTVPLGKRELTLTETVRPRIGRRI